MLHELSAIFLQKLLVLLELLSKLYQSLPAAFLLKTWESCAMHTVLRALPAWLAGVPLCQQFTSAVLPNTSENTVSLPSGPASIMCVLRRDRE